MPKRPDLTLPLAQPITLTGGPRSHLVTLMDAAILIRMTSARSGMRRALGQLTRLHPFSRICFRARSLQKTPYDRPEAAVPQTPDHRKRDAPFNSGNSVGRGGREARETLRE